MTGTTDITMADIPGLDDVIRAAVEHLSSMGEDRISDWAEVIDRIESRCDFDFGADMGSPEIREILKIARKHYRELRAESF